MTNFAANQFRAIGSLGCALSMMGLMVATAGMPARAAESELEKRVARLTTAEGRLIGKNRIAGDKFLQRFYAHRQYKPAWTNPATVEALQNAVAESWIDGLRPADFHASAIGVTEESGASGKLTDVERDILLSDALVRLLYQLYFGKVSPTKLDSDWNYERKLPSENPAKLVSDAIDAGKIAELVKQLSLSHPYYLELRATLQAYTEYDIRGGWPKIDPGAALKAGMADARVAQVRARLAVTGHYTPNNNAAPEAYDETLLEAVKRFQADHGIDVDGAIGPATLRALNVTARQRVDQIRANLERARWVVRSLIGKKDLVLVNIAGFYLRLHLDGKRVWETGVITGRPYHKTPVFTEDMKFVVLNPDWTVPRSIIRKEIFPKAKANPSYLTSGNYKLVSSSGAEVSPQSLNWQSLSASSFPYRVVQRPGPNNALGLVKFMFPNKHAVYLHDTPSRQLFSKTGRAFSHGCIRVEDPMKFAELILGNRAGWTRAQIDQVVASKKMQRVNLSKELPVAILYWTVDPIGAGSAKFYEDVYGRDARLIAALNGEFRPVQQGAVKDK